MFQTSSEKSSEREEINRRRKGELGAEPGSPGEAHRRSPEVGGAGLRRWRGSGQRRLARAPFILAGSCEWNGRERLEQRRKKKREREKRGMAQGHRPGRGAAGEAGLKSLLPPF